jgi:hypothetical protein
MLYRQGIAEFLEAIAAPQNLAFDANPARKV